MRNGALALVGSFLGAALLAVALPSQAVAAGSDPATGNDVSYPQCAAAGSASVGTLPADPAFGVVGLNKGLANNFNSCVGAEVSWAASSPGTALQPSVARYVNTGDPALAGSWWPASNETQSNPPLPAGSPTITPIAVSTAHGVCAHKAGAACAYVYGYSMAYSDFVAAGSPLGATWWLDVETENTWQKDTAANAADLVGMIDYFRSQGGTVGLYSTASQWATIAGKTSSTSALAGLPSWIAGSSSSGAPAACQKTGLTPRSRVGLVQYHVGTGASAVDTDLSCGVLTTPVPTITGTGAIGTIVRAATTGWGPGAITLKYQWYRSGVAISGSTKSYHTVQSADLNKHLTVTVTGSEPSYTTAAVTSAGLAIYKSLTATPKPTISGTLSSGHTLTAARGTWAPAPVTLTFQWLRDGSPIAGATAKTYLLTSEDSGHSITVAVTGSRSGYRTVTETSAAKTIAGAIG